MDTQLEKQYTTNFDRPCGTCGGYAEDHDEYGCLECGRCGEYIGRHEIKTYTDKGVPIYSCPKEEI